MLEHDIVDNEKAVRLFEILLNSAVFVFSSNYRKKQNVCHSVLVGLIKKS